jgi:hypothetical protein
MHGSRMNALLDELRRADASLQAERLPPSAVRRVGRRIDEELADTDGSTRMPRWVPMATFAGGAALVLAVLAIGGPRRDASPEATGTIVRGADCESDGAKISGRCDVKMAEPAMTIHTARADVELHGRVIDVHGGQADFDVDPVHEAPVRVKVPGGQIVVVGTRFRVEVDAAAQRGVVILHEGRLRFEADDGRVSAIEAGETFAFGVKALAQGDAVDRDASAAAIERDREDAPEAGSNATASKAPSTAVRRPATRLRAKMPTRPDAAEPAPIDVDALITAVDASRRTGDYHGAADALRAALRGHLDLRAREVLSYELGTILGGHLKDTEQACAHWSEHHRRFGDGRYGKQVARARAQLGCLTDAD